MWIWIECQMLLATWKKTDKNLGKSEEKSVQNKIKGRNSHSSNSSLIVALQARRDCVTHVHIHQRWKVGKTHRRCYTANGMEILKKKISKISLPFFTSSSFRAVSVMSVKSSPRSSDNQQCEYISWSRQVKFYSLINFLFCLYVCGGAALATSSKTWRHIKSRISLIIE